MNDKLLTHKALQIARDAELLLAEIRAEFDLYKVTVQQDYAAMAASMELLGTHMATHTHPYTDIDNTGVVQNKTTGNPS